MEARCGDACLVIGVGTLVITKVKSQTVQCVNFFENRCFHHHGLLPADPCFAQEWDKIPQVDEGDPDPLDVDPDGLSERWVQSGYEIVIMVALLRAKKTTP